MIEGFDGKMVAVIGLARSGLACAEALLRAGAKVRVYDNKPEDALAEPLAAARSLGLDVRAGGAPVDFAEIDFLVPSPGVPRTSAVLTDALAHGVHIIGEIEVAYRLASAPIVAVTGTNGKTTTTILVGEMLRAAGIETYIAGNVAAGEISMPLSRAALLAPATAAIVAEVSSFQLEWITLFRPRVAGLLNITADHGDRQTWEEYVNCKWRIFENQTEADYAVLSPALSPEARLRGVKARVREFGAGAAGDVRARVRNGCLGIETADCNGVSWQQICYAEELKLPGHHNVENVLAAATMAVSYGASLAAVREVAIHFAGVVHRLEYVDTVDGVRYVNNSMCTNVAAIERSLDALPEEKIVIMGGVFKGSPAELEAMARAASGRNVSKLVLIGRDAPQIEAAVKKNGFGAVERAASMVDAVSRARRSAAPGQTVMLAPGCASFDMFRDFEDRGDQFKRAVEELEGAHKK